VVLCKWLHLDPWHFLQVSDLGPFGPSCSFFHCPPILVTNIAVCFKQINIVTGIANLSDKYCVFGQKGKNTTTTKRKNKHKNPCRSPCTQSGCVITALSQLRVSIVVKPFNCFEAMGRNVNIQSHIYRPDIFNKYIFL